jgi:hypothetical protein
MNKTKMLSLPIDETKYPPMALPLFNRYIINRYGNEIKKVRMFGKLPFTVIAYL